MLRRDYCKDPGEVIGCATPLGCRKIGGPPLDGPNKSEKGTKLTGACGNPIGGTIDLRTGGYVFAEATF